VISEEAEKEKQRQALLVSILPECHARMYRFHINGLWYSIVRLQKAVVEDDIEESGDVRDWRTRTDQPGSKQGDSWEQQQAQQQQQPPKAAAPQVASSHVEVRGKWRTA
jgi:hypothetical protein